MANRALGGEQITLGNAALPDAEANQMVRSRKQPPKARIEVKHCADDSGLCATRMRTLYNRLKGPSLSKG